MGYSRQILVLVIAALFHCRAEPNAPGKPKITPVVFPEGLSSGQRASTTCTVVSGEPPFSFEWYKDGQIIESFKSKSVVAQKGVSLLTIDPLALEDAGNYTCTVTNSFGTDSASARLTVNGPPLWKNEPQDVSTEKGQDVVFHCEAEGFPKPTSVWKKKVADNENEDTLSHGRRISIDKQGTLTISGVQKEDEGTYICEASNNVGTPLRKSVKLDIHDPPKIQPFQFSGRLQSGGKTNVPCLLNSGQSPVTFQWKKDGKELVEMHNVHVETGQHSSVLVLNPVDLNSIGNYTCIASNEFGRDSNTMEVLVEAAPKWYSEPNDVEATLGSAIEISCEAGGLPPPKIHWRKIDLQEKEGNVVKKSTPLNIESSRNQNGFIHIAKLVVQKTSPTDIGQYECVAENGVGSPLKKIVNININDTPVIQPLSFPSKVTTGVKVSAACTVMTGTPPYTFIWKKGDKDVGYMKNVEIQNNSEHSILVINPVDTDSMGNYTCIVTNHHGSDKATAELKVEAAPLWIKEPHDLEARIGDKVMIECQADGLPKPKVTWRKANGANGPQDVLDRKISSKLSTTDGTLVFLKLEAIDGGHYECSADNGVGQTLRKVIAIQIHVSEAPKVQRFSFNEKLKAGTKTGIPCIVQSGSPPFAFRWTKDGEEIAKLSSNNMQITVQSEQVSLLTLDPITMTSKGNYTCEVTNSGGTTSLTVHVDLEAAPEWVVKPADTIKGTIGENIRIECSVQGIPTPKISWKKLKQEIGSSKDKSLTSSSIWNTAQMSRKGTSSRITLHQDGSLVIQRVEGSDEGNYECVAENGVGEPLRKVVALAIQGSPKISPFVFPNSVTEKANVKVLCNVLEGSKPFSFKWLKDARDFDVPSDSTHAHIQIHDDYSLLQFNEVDALDSGNYTCQVENRNGMASYSARLIVQVPPKWIAIPDGIIKVEENGTAILKCQSTGNPQPKVIWRRVSEREEAGKETFVLSEVLQSLGSRITVDASEGIFHIRRVSSQDAGDYKCDVHNGIGEGLSKVITLSVHVPARFEEKFSSMTVKRGDSAKLQCNALGDQPLIINWKKDTTEMRNRGDARHEILETMSNKGVLSELIIRETERSDSALYKCTCENGYGKDERTIKLTILEVPSQPLNIRIEATWSRSVSVAWAHPYNGNSPITKYVIQYWKNEGAPHRLNEHEVSGSQTTALIKELRPGKPYALAVVAENDVGRGDPSVTVPFHTGEEEPSAAPVDVLTETKGSTSVLVSWKAPPKEEWNGELRGYYVGYKAVSSDQPYSFKTVDFSASLMQDHLLTNLRKDTEYNIVVKAFNSAGSGPESQELRVHTLSGDLPSPPSLRLVSATEQSIEVGWRPGPQGVPLSGFTLHYRREGGPWKATPLLSAHESSFKLKDLQEGTLYYLYLTASNSYGAGDPSEVLKVKTSAVDMQIIPDSEVRTSEMPFYFDLTLIVPALASFATVVVVCVVACLWVKRVQAKRTIVEQAYQQQNQFIYTGPSQRYVDIEKPRPPSIQSDHGSTTDLYPSPYATIPVQDNTLTRNKKELHQEMKIYFQSGCAPKPNMKDRPLPKPSEEPNTVRSDHVYDSAQ